MNRKKDAKICEDWSSRKEDLISKLPDPLLCDILYHISTEESVRTSVLSKRWRSVWLSVLGLDLEYRKYWTCVSFMRFLDRFFESHKESWISKLKLCLKNPDDDARSFFTKVIDAVTRCKIQHLDVITSIYHMPLSLYTCETLVELQLSSVTLPNAIEFIFLPCLKMMRLGDIIYEENVTTFEKLISACPVLEDLLIISCSRSSRELFHAHHDVKVLQVGSRTLKRIDIGSIKIKAVIDAPLLECLKTRIYETKNFKIINSDFSARLDIDIVYGKNVTRDILIETPRIRDLVISGNMWKDIDYYSKSTPLLRFCYLSHLHAKNSTSSNLQMLPTILECCPKLESLILEMVEVRNPSKFRIYLKLNWMLSNSTVPQCLVSSLKFVELKGSVIIYKRVMDLARYFLKNAAILEKLKFDLHCTEIESGPSVKKLMQCQDALVLVKSFFSHSDNILF